MVHKEENPWKVQVTLSQGLLGYHSRNLHLLVTMQAVILPSSVRSCLTEELVSDQVLRSRWPHKMMAEATILWNRLAEHSTRCFLAICVFTICLFT